MITTTSADHVLHLRDGRSLGYREYGDPDGFPVFLFHGIPGSRRGASVIDHEAIRGGVRVIGVDRPGIGLSTFQPGRSFLDWPADVAAVADALELGRFGVVGNSGGSAYVAACALCIPERLAFAGIISGMGPIDVPRWQEELKLPRVRRILIAIGRRSPYLACRVAGPVLQREIDPARPGTLERMKSIMAPADQFLLNQPEVARTVLEDAAEALDSGIARRCLGSPSLHPAMGIPSARRRGADSSLAWRSGHHGSANFWACHGTATAPLPGHVLAR